MIREKSLSTALRKLTNTIQKCADEAPAEYSKQYLDSIKEDLVFAYVRLLDYFWVDVNLAELDDEDNPQFEDFDRARADSRKFSSFGDYIEYTAWKYISDTFLNILDDASDDDEAVQADDYITRKMDKAKHSMLKESRRFYYR